MQLIDRQEKVAKMTTSNAKDFIVAIIREELHKALTEELHVVIGSTFL